MLLLILTIVGGFAHVKFPDKSLLLYKLPKWTEDYQKEEPDLFNDDFDEINPQLDPASPSGNFEIGHIYSPSQVSFHVKIVSTYCYLILL